MLNLPKITFRQVAVMFAVILASVTTGFHNRLLLVALPDLRGIWGLDVDEGTILISLALAPQLLLAPIAPWLSRTVGIRRTVIPASLLLAFVTFLIPFLHGFVSLVIAHAAAGALFGIFITLSIAVLNKNLPPAWMVVPLAFYSYSLTFSINTGVTVGGFYIEQLGWHWIYWQTSLLMLVYLLVVWSCSVEDDPVQKEMIAVPTGAACSFSARQRRSFTSVFITESALIGLIRALFPAVFGAASFCSFFFVSTNKSPENPGLRFIRSGTGMSLCVCC